MYLFIPLKNYIIKNDIISELNLLRTGNITSDYLIIILKKNIYVCKCHLIIILKTYIRQSWSSSSTNCKKFREISRNIQLFKKEDIN